MPAMNRAFERLGKIGLGAMTAGGAAMGGVLGGLSEEGSFFGGALKGGALGAAAYGLGRRGLHGAMSYQGWRAGGVGVGQALRSAVQSEARISARLIGSSYTRAVNGFKALGGTGSTKQTMKNIRSMSDMTVAALRKNMGL